MNTKLTLFVAVLAAALFGVGCASPLEKGLVAYYPFNGNAKDESGNGNDGGVSGAILTTDRHGKEENAYLFDNKNDYIDIPNHPSLHLNNEMTISIWLKLDSLPDGSSHYILTKAWYEGLLPDNSNFSGRLRRGLQMKI